MYRFAPPACYLSLIPPQIVRGEFPTHFDPTDDEFYKFIAIDSQRYLLDFTETNFSQLESSESGRPPIVGAYLHHFNGGLLVYSVTSRSSFEYVKVIHEQIRRVMDDRHFCVMLVGNKSDHAAARQVERSEGETLTNEFRCSFMEITVYERGRRGRGCTRPCD